MKLVEVIRAPGTSDDAITALVKVGERMGRVPVVVQDSPGFLVNLGGRAYTQEALRIVAEGVATPAQVDAVMRSEEHTSELQSLMRISYAVFCLKKKKQIQQ